MFITLEGLDGSCYHVSDLAGSQDILCDRYIHSTLAYNWPFTESIADDICRK